MFWSTHIHTHAQLFNDPLSRTTRVGRYHKKHSPTHTHPVHQTSFINFLHLLRSTASSLFSLHAWQSFSTFPVQVLFGLPLGLGPSTSCSMHFFTQSSSFFRNTCPCRRSLWSKVIKFLVVAFMFHCSAEWWLPVLLLYDWQVSLPR